MKFKTIPFIIYFTIAFGPGFTAPDHLESNSRVPEYCVPLSEIKHATHADFQFLWDNEGREWIFKQITEKAATDQIVNVLEVWAAEIASEAGIPINRVELISANDRFEPRFFAEYPGTLHLRVPGIRVEELAPWPDFDLHQKFRSAYVTALRGPLPSKKIGLRKEVIETMSGHPDLPKIVALDTVTGNNDRSNSNIFYDEVTDRFYGIDMGNCLADNLAARACEQLERLSVSYTFSSDEQRALKEYKDALTDLTIRFPPDKTIPLLEHYLEAGGFTFGSPLHSAEVEQTIEKWKNTIEEGYGSTLVLIELIENLLRKR